MAIGTPTQRYAVNQANQTTTTTLSPTTNVVATTFAVLCAVSSAKLISSVSDNAGGNTWVVDRAFTGNGRSVSFASCQVATQIGTGNVITITWDVATSTGTAIWVLEVTGIATSSAADTGGSGTAASGTAASAGPTATLSQADEIAFAGFRAAAAVSLTKGASWSQPTTGTLNTNAAIEYQIVAATTALTADGTWGGTTAWAGAIQTYKADVATGHIPRNLLMGVG